MIQKLKTCLNNNVEPSIRKYFLFSLFDLSVGCVGMIVYGILTSTYGVIWVRNQYFGLWLTTLVFFYSIQSIYIELKKWPKLVYYINDVTFIAVSILLQFLMIVFYGLGHKIDVIIWSIYLFAVNLTNLYILIVRKANNLAPKLEIVNNSETLDLARSNDVKKTFPKRSILIRIVRVINFIVRLFFIIIMCLLVNGAIVDGTGFAKFKSIGKTINVALNDNSGRTIKINYLCDGPIDSSKPIFMFEGSFSHALADYLSIQALLKENNRRSCIWDKPGLGFSDYLYTDLKSYMKFYDNMINGFGETGSYSFVGWGGGGEIIYEYASKYPQKVAALTFLDSTPNGIEFDIPRILKNWSQSQYDEYKSSQISSRFRLFSLINGLGVPWGLMSLLTPSSQSETFYNRFSEQIRWSFLTEKSWITQEFYLAISKNEISPFKRLNISQTIPINIIMSKKSDQQIRDQVCQKRNLDPNSSECKYEIDSNKLMINIKSDLLSLSKNGKLIECIQDECDLGYLVGKGSNYTVQKLLTL